MRTVLFPRRMDRLRPSFSHGRIIEAVTRQALAARLVEADEYKHSRIVERISRSKGLIHISNVRRPPLPRNPLQSLNIFHLGTGQASSHASRMACNWETFVSVGDRVRSSTDDSRR